MKKTHKLLLLIALSPVLSFSMFSQGKDFSKNTKSSQTETAKASDEELKSFVILEGKFQHEFNPQTTATSEDAELLTGLYEGLFSYNPQTLEPVYAIASGYKISRDKKRWTFTINENACFSNGEKITAKNVRDSWIKLLSNPDSPYASMLDVIEGASDFRAGKTTSDKVAVYAQDVLTLSIRLTKPANYLPKLLCHTAFSVVYTSNPEVYSGPYVMKEKDEEKGIFILRKNPYYWDKDNVEMEQITFIQNEDPEENTYFYNNGMADWGISYCNYEKILNRDSVKFNALFGTCYLFFRNSCKKGEKGNDIWDIKKFRQAVLEAFPWKEFRKDYYVQAETFVYPLKGYPVVEGFDYTDMIEAKKLMSEAKAEAGLEENSQIQITFDVAAGYFSTDQIKLLKNAFTELGVKLNVREIKYNYYDSLAVSDADVAVYSWIGDFADPLSFLELYRSDSTLNEAGWKNPEFDALLDEAATASDSQRYEYLAQAETLLLDDYMIIPVYHTIRFNVINMDDFSGWYPNAFDIHPLKYIKRNKFTTKVPNVI